MGLVPELKFKYINKFDSFHFMQSHAKTEFVVSHTVCRRCENRTSCSLTNVDFPGDPCPDTYKYVELNYVCRPGRFIIVAIVRRPTSGIL